MYLYSGLIKCKLCGKNFRGKKERGKKCYICSGYHNYRNCKRIQLDEEDIDFVVKRHIPKSEVKLIEVHEDKIVIYYENGTQSLINSNQIIF